MEQPVTDFLKKHYDPESRETFIYLLENDMAEVHTTDSLFSYRAEKLNYQGKLHNNIAIFTIPQFYLLRPSFRRSTIQKPVLSGKP